MSRKAVRWSLDKSEQGLCAERMEAVRLRAETDFQSCGKPGIWAWKLIGPPTVERIKDAVPAGS